MHENLSTPKQHRQTSICIAAILRDEERFLDEWLVYHRLIGIDHFYLYDDSPALPLADFVRPHASYVTVIPWYNRNEHLAGRNRQTKAYQYTVDHFSAKFEWMACLDGDEFLVLDAHRDIQHFLGDFEAFSGISLHWHTFGHNGYYEDPEGLITASLTRRKRQPGIHVKSLVRMHCVEKIDTVHFCRLKEHCVRADGNKQIFKDSLYPGKTAVAHINHYQSRSFKTWMRRVERGDTHNEANQNWRANEEECLKQFVMTVALDKNEYVDESMLRYQEAILEKLQEIDRPSTYRQL